ncbi:hypothetical protein [Photobacterium leiognathi]|uniref:hypothetical protein n=1 Tax=Photobacterium leiognathi TaxID=553611 RepID=UPI00298132BE|nr:hypothetical protein [Photobacterium leiognathi]
MADNKTINQNHDGSGNNVAGNLNIFNYYGEDYKLDLALATLIGSWDENKKVDKAYIEQLTEQPYDDWIKKIRTIERNQESPIKHKSGVWFFSDRKLTWMELSSCLYNDHLDKFKQIAIQVLTARDPALELEPQQRPFAAIFDKTPEHSHQLYRGIAEGLALIASHHKHLGNCDENYGKVVSKNVIEQTFDNADWTRWAASKDVQPILAEIAPEQFFNSIENAIDLDENPIGQLFEQEDPKDIFSPQYTVGLQWTFERLAWIPRYLSQSVIMLAYMYNCKPITDPKAANPAVTAISRILNLYFPQTNANNRQRFGALKALERNSADTAWKVTLKLLPNYHSCILLSSCRPEWQEDFTPYDRDDYKLTYEEIDQYCSYAVELAKKDISRLPALIEHLCSLTQEAFDKAVSLIECYTGELKNTELGTTLWTTLSRLIKTHRKYADTNWSMEETKLCKLDKIKTNLEPTEFSLLYRPLFSQSSMELVDDYSNWLEAETIVKEKRTNAITAIYSQGGVDKVHQFSLNVQFSEYVGKILSHICTDYDYIISRYICCNNIKTKKFINGYILHAYYTTQADFIKEIDFNNWNNKAISNLLINLPFEPQAWNLVEELLDKEEQGLYWLKVQGHLIFSRETNYDDLYLGIQSLLEYGRAVTAVRCLYQIKVQTNDLKLDYVITALNLIGLSNSGDECLDEHTLMEVLKYAINHPSVSEETKLLLEIRFNHTLSDNQSGKHTTPPTVSKKMATDPAFFCELIKYAFIPDHVDSKPKLTAHEQNAASNCYKLIDNWKLVPGTLDDGTFDYEFFCKWKKSVIEIAIQSGHLLSASTAINRTLIYTPTDRNGEWIDLNIAAYLDDKESKKAREDFAHAVYESRGVRTIDPEGKPEIKLAQLYKDRADEMSIQGFARFAYTLETIADNYKQEAEYNIKRYSDCNNPI